MPGGFSSGFSSGFGIGQGTYRFLVDHWINNRYIEAGETHLMDPGFQPTPDVDPLDVPAVQAFYLMGPALGAAIISRRTGVAITAPITYWYQVAPLSWALSGLGSNQSVYPPINAHIGRIE
jgi:hypothetical protein